MALAQAFFHIKTTYGFLDHGVFKVQATIFNIPNQVITHYTLEIKIIA